MAEIETEVRERPILFSGEMVRAILDGRKTQTRRAVTLRNSVWGPTNYREPSERFWNHADFSRAHADTLRSLAKEFGRGCEMYLHVPCHQDVQGGCAVCDDWGYTSCSWRLYPRYSIGDRLWVRETWAWESTSYIHGFFGGPLSDDKVTVAYAVDGVTLVHRIPHGTFNPGDANSGRRRPSIHMPRWASRITLEIEDVRVERVQAISEQDAIAEGCSCGGGISSGPMDPIEHDGYSAAQDFAALWDSINARRGYSWESNCWVWVISFRRIDHAD